MKNLLEKIVDWLAEVKLPIIYFRPPNELEKKMEMQVLDIYDKDPILGVPVVVMGESTKDKVIEYWEGVNQIKNNLK